jgi:DNA repair protein SbcC/Rad50
MIPNLIQSWHMIPLRLQLKNFMSYGEGVPPLDLSGIRLACLSGDNGNGKTAILDAMTWALFGETRAPSEDDLVRLGAADCGVLFDFKVADSRYRIKRQRDKKRGTIWELQVWQEDGTLRPLTGTNTRETKAKIESLLRMDYKTFLTTSYLSQGRADEFARASVNDRKKVLADILDLTRYEKLEQLAKDQVLAAKELESQLERELVRIDAILSQFDAYQAALDTAQQRYDLLETEKVTLFQAYTAFFAQCENLEKDEETYKDRESRIKERQRDIETATREKQRFEKRIGEAEQIVSERAKIEANAALKTQIEAQLKPLEAQYSLGVKLLQEQNNLQKEIAYAENKIEREYQHIAHQIDLLQQEQADLEKYSEQINHLEIEITSFAHIEESLQNAERQKREFDLAFAELKAKNSAYKAEIAKCELRIERINTASESECEYCGQPLTESGKQQAIADAEAQIVAIKHDLQQLGEDGRKTQEASKQAQREEADLRSALRQRDVFQTQLLHAKQEHLRLASRLATLPQQQLALEQLRVQLTSRAFAPEAQERLLQVSAQLEKFERVEAELAQKRQDLQVLQGVEAQMARLEQALLVLETEPQLREETCQRIVQWQEQVEKAEAQLTLLSQRLVGLPKLRQQRDEAHIQLKTHEREQEQIGREIAAAQNYLSQCAEAQKERADYQERHTEARRQQGLYKELQAAFSRKGIQALLIENALPEIEEEANRLLKQMTNNAMTLKLQTQREAKTKTTSGTGTIETLDIVIGDDMGTRPYEMYSGGEIFRINLALRVALSKLLARRSGAPLQTLILDEGFGTQDPRGREAIADALQAISADFALVLVITHIEELKDAFPTRIEVTKEASGSVIRVV